MRLSASEITSQSEALMTDRLEMNFMCSCNALGGPFECLCVVTVPRFGAACRSCRDGHHDFYDMRNAQALVAAERAKEELGT